MIRAAIVMLLLTFTLAITTGCANLDEVRAKVDVLEAKNDELEEKFKLYVESDARSTALAEQALENIRKAIDALKRYVERVR